MRNYKLLIFIYINTCEWIYIFIEMENHILMNE